jgi:hypothetical protein
MIKLSKILTEETPIYNNRTNESVINEEYIEAMDLPELEKALGKVAILWKEWKKGPMTIPSDIKPAKNELKDYLDRWFKDNIK